MLVAVLRKHLGYLNINESDFQRFAAEFPLPSRSVSRMSWAGIAAPVYSWTGLGKLVPATSRFRRLEENIVGTFLLSTDFFWRGSDEEREILYVGYYDPYQRPCQNPFARLI